MKQYFTLAVFLFLTTAFAGAQQGALPAKKPAKAISLTKTQAIPAEEPAKAASLTEAQAIPAEEPAKAASLTEAQAIPAEEPAKAASLTETQTIPAPLHLDEEKTIIAPLPPMPNDDSLGPRSALSVARLPDIKLNENLISKTVLDYKTAPALAAANNLYAAGQTSQALEEFKKVSAIQDNPKAAAQAFASIALIEMQQANMKEALFNIEKALSLEEANPLYQLLKVWAYALKPDLKQAQKSYEALLFLTADFEYLSSAKLAMITAGFSKKDYKTVMPALQNLYSSNPYTISHAAYLMGRINFDTKSLKEAKTLFEQSLAFDYNNYMAQYYLAKTDEKLSNYVAAWQEYASLFAIDAKNKEFEKKLKKLSKHLKARPVDYLFYAKLSEIYTKPSAAESRSLPLRVGLYARLDGNLTPVNSFTFIAGTNFTITEEKMGDVITGEAFTPKTIIWDAQNKGVHIKNRWDTIEFSTKRPFVLKLSRPAAMQVQDIEAKDIFASNLGDKELKGSLLVIPSDEGMLLINNTKLDDVLPSLVTFAARGIKEPAVLEALTITLRTHMMKEIYDTAQSGALYDMADYSKDLQFGGVNMQSSVARAAAQDTEDYALAEPKTLVDENEENKIEFQLASPQFYRACSIVTEDGIANTKTSSEYNFTPLNLFQFMISNPPKDLFSAPQDPTLWSAVKWIYSIPAKDIEQRFKAYYPQAGDLKGFSVSSFSLYGRTLKVLFKGSKKSIELGFEDANFILAAGTLRSDFFLTLPVLKGGKADEYLFLGTDTGNGNGLCINGADGMAREEGKTASEILRYYYPDYKITTEWQKQKSLL